MKWLQWEHGRQGGGYSRLLLAHSKRLKFDLYLLRLPCTSMVRHHTDPVIPEFEHHRVNITLRAAKIGGKTFIATGSALHPWYTRAARVYHFRPDLLPHYVTPVMKGSVWLLSFGWLRKSK